MDGFLELYLEEELRLENAKVVEDGTSMPLGSGDQQPPPPEHVREKTPPPKNLNPQ